MLESASCTRINDIIRKKLIRKNSKILHIWTWCSLRWHNYFFAALQIIFSLACVSIETHKLSPSTVLGASGPLTKKKFAKLCFRCLRYSKFGQQILPNYVASSSPRSVISVTQPCFWNAAMILLRGLRRMTMKACIDAFWPNTSQANYFKGFWRITSKINAKIQVRK